MIDQDPVLIDNLEKQKLLFTKMLDISSRQLSLVQSTRGNIDVESLNNMLAERQNLMERIDCLKKAMPKKSIAGELDHMKGLFKEILNLVQEIDLHDQASRELVQEEYVIVKTQLKKARANKTANTAYINCYSAPEGYFFDERK